MRLEGIIWIGKVIEKLAKKHRVKTYEVEEALDWKPLFRLMNKGNRKGEDVFMALGKTQSGRYLSVLFIYNVTKEAIIISARDMAKKERKLYERR